MPKRVANGLTLLSAVVCVGSALLVGRSFLRSDLVDGELWGATIDGHVIIVIETAARPRPRPLTYVGSEAAAPFRDVRERLLEHKQWAIRWLRIGWVDFMTGVRVVILPFWPLPLLTAIPPLRWWRARRREGGRGFAVEGADHGTRADGIGAGDAD